MTTPPTLARLRELREKHREFGPATAALLDFAIAQAEATEKHRDLFPFTSAGFIGGVYVEAKPECYTALSKAFSELTRKLADEKAKKDDALNNLDRYKTSVDNSLALLRNERDYWRTITKDKQVALDNLTRERDDALAKLVEAQKTVSFPRWADHPEHQAVVKERDDALAALARERKDSTEKDEKIKYLKECNNNQAKMLSRSRPFFYDIF